LIFIYKLARKKFYAAELKNWIHHMNLQQDLGRNMHMDWSDDIRLCPIHPWRYILDCHLQYMAANVNNMASQLDNRWK
jgi:hypothetical protein